MRSREVFDLSQRGAAEVTLWALTLVRGPKLLAANLAELATPPQ
jgi:hypothetical protein